jgi:hypothetical protein
MQEKENNCLNDSPGTPVSSINKTDRHDITEILPNVELNTITLTRTLFGQSGTYEAWSNILSFDCFWYRPPLLKK